MSFWFSAAVAQEPRLTEIVGGFEHTCALDTRGRVWCWGRGSEGQLGDGTFERRVNPVRVQGIGRVAALVAGSAHTCALTRSGQVRCWGWNGMGQLGDNSTTDRELPVRVRGLGTSEVLSITAGSDFSCARFADGRARCWGGNAFGQLGNGTIENSSRARRVARLNDVVGMVSGFWHSCALIADGRMRCWGRNENRQLGDGTEFNRPRPVRVPGFRHGFGVPDSQGSGETAPAFGGDPDTAVVIGALSTLAYGGQRNRLFGVGRNLQGALGLGDDIDFIARMTRLGPAGVARMAAGDLHSCYIAARNGRMFCTGDNARGQLGIGSYDPITVYGYTPVDGPAGYSALGAGSWHTCGIRQGRGYCQGEGTAGQLGNGSFASSPYPIPIVWENIN